MIKDPKQLLNRESLKFYTPLAMLFVSLLLVVNIIGQKIVPIWGNIILTPADFIYPLDYIISIILTEVYGYAMSRRVIWCGLGCNIVVVSIISMAIAMPPSPVWHNQSSFALILGNTQRLVIASLTAFAIGEFVGTYILAKAKIFTSGKYLWLRTIGATLIGQGIDCIVFTTIAFSNALALKELSFLLIATYCNKILFQFVLTPGVYALVKFLKNIEGVDIYDRNTNFNPFNLGLK